MEVFEEKIMSNEKKNEVISKDLMTIPNAISFFRIILITPFVALFIVGRYLTKDYTPAIIVLVISSLRNKRENQPPASLGLPYFREER